MTLKFLVVAGIVANLLTGHVDARAQNIKPGSAKSSLSPRLLAKDSRVLRGSGDLVAEIYLDDRETPFARGPGQVGGRRCLVTNKRYVAELVDMMSDLKIAKTAVGRAEFSTKLVFKSAKRIIYEAEFPVVGDHEVVTLGSINGHDARLDAGPIIRFTKFVEGAFVVPPDVAACSKVFDQ